MKTIRNAKILCKCMRKFEKIWKSVSKNGKVWEPEKLRETMRNSRLTSNSNML